MITSDSSVLWVALSFELLRGERSNEQYLCVAAHHQRDFGVCNRQSTCHTLVSADFGRIMTAEPMLYKMYVSYVNEQLNIASYLELG